MKILKLNLHRQTKVYIFLLDLVLSYPELDRYNKMMELGMQTCNTFE